MSILKGYAIPTKIPGADHTYVKSDSPAYSWGCWGRDAGGKEICGGSGNASIANCISQPSSHAGIVYMITGVCHQTANRILFPAGVVVSKAGGYKVSVAVYGTYGKGKKEWQGRRKKCGIGGIRNPSESAADMASSPEDGERAYLQKVVAIYSEAELMDEETSISLLGEELKLMMEFGLGRGLDSQIIGSAQRQQADFLKMKQEMDQEFYDDKLSVDKYVQEANEGVGGLLRQLAEVLGKDQFERVFGLAPPSGSFMLIDPEIAARVHSRG